MATEVKVGESPLGFESNRVLSTRCDGCGEPILHRPVHVANGATGSRVEADFCPVCATAAMKRLFSLMSVTMGCDLIEGWKRKDL